MTTLEYMVANKESIFEPERAKKKEVEDAQEKHDDILEPSEDDDAPLPMEPSINENDRRV